MSCKLILSLLLSIFVGSAFSQVDSLFIFQNFEDAKVAASNDQKNIFLEVYSHNCSTCKEIYKAPKIIDLLAEDFVVVRINGKKKGRKFARKNKIKDFPSFVIYSSQGEKLYVAKGMVDVEDLVEIVEFSQTNPIKQSKIYKERYIKAKNEPLFLVEYLEFAKKLNNAKLIKKIYKQYAKNINKLDSIEWMNFVLEHVHEKRPQIHKLFVENKEKFDTVFGIDTVGQIYLDIAIRKEICRSCNKSSEKLIQNIRKRLTKDNVILKESKLYSRVSEFIFYRKKSIYDNSNQLGLSVKVLVDYPEEIGNKTLKLIIGNIAI